MATGCRRRGIISRSIGLALSLFVSTLFLFTDDAMNMQTIMYCVLLS